jgi:phage shock protein C
MENRLYRDEQHKMIGGVCSGLADYFNVDVALVRVIFVLALILKGGGVLIYIVLWIVMPKRPFIAPSVTYGAIPQPQPIVPVAKSTTTGRLIGGLILIMLGGFFLLDQFNLIPDLDFDKFWPLVLIVIGLVLIFGFWQRKPVVEEHTKSWETKDPLNDTTSTDTTQNI